MSLVTLRMGWRNLGRNMKRTLLAIGAMAAVVTFGDMVDQVWQVLGTGVSAALSAGG